MTVDPIPLTGNEALSGIAGSVSLASWIFLLVPQLIENYQRGSADGISLTFIIIWFIGDITNLVGAIWAGLVPTVIAIAVYFSFADVILIAQCLWYRALNAREEKELQNGVGYATAENTPLLNGASVTSPTSPTTRLTNSLTDVRNDNLGLPGSRRRSSAASSKRLRRQSSNALERIMEEPTRTRAWLKNVISILAIIAAGTAGWAIAWKTGAWRPSPVVEDGSGVAPVGATILGYLSAVAYLGARIPQILKNQRDRSCEGLSLLFFLLSLMGNATYGAGILFHSVEKKYFFTNLPWLIGSLGTMAEDAIIFIQFSVFGEGDRTVETSAIAGEAE